MEANTTQALVPPTEPPSPPPAATSEQLAPPLSPGVPSSTGSGGTDAEVARLRAEVEKLKAGKVRRGEQLRRLMAELKAVRASRMGAETAFEHLNEAVAGLRREEERRADQAVAERNQAVAELQTERAATAAAEARANAEQQRANAAEAAAKDAQARLAQWEQEREALATKLAEEQQRADRVLIHNLQLASRVRQLEQEAEGSLGPGGSGQRADLERGGAGADGAGRGLLLGYVQAAWNQRDHKGVMVITVLALLIFWYISTAYSS